jgi:mRNA interferase MazF
MNDFPKRGEVWLVNWNPARGSEQAGRRPALVIQNDIGNEKAPTTIVAAISGSLRIYPMNVKVNPPEGGLDRPSIIKTSQILTVAKERLEKRLGLLNQDRMDDVDRAIKLSLALLS